MSVESPTDGEYTLLTVQNPDDPDDVHGLCAHRFVVISPAPAAPVPAEPRRCVIKIGDDQELSRTVQELLFSVGIKWCDGTSVVSAIAGEQYGEDACLIVDGERLGYADEPWLRDTTEDGGASDHENHRWFDARTQLAELREYLGLPAVQERAPAPAAPTTGFPKFFVLSNGESFGNGGVYARWNGPDVGAVCVNAQGQDVTAGADSWPPHTVREFIGSLWREITQQEAANLLAGGAVDTTAPFPRYFLATERFNSDRPGVFARWDSLDAGSKFISASNEEVDWWVAPPSFFVRDGEWREVTREEAEALLDRPAAPAPTPAPAPRPPFRNAIIFIGNDQGLSRRVQEALFARGYSRNGIQEVDGDVNSVAEPAIYGLRVTTSGEINEGSTGYRDDPWPGYERLNAAENWDGMLAFLDGREAPAPAPAPFQNAWIRTPTEELNRRVQEMLASCGYRWSRTETHHDMAWDQYQEDSVIFTHEDGSLTYCNNDYAQERHLEQPKFDTATQWDQIVAFFRPPAQAAPAPAVRPPFRRCWVKIGDDEALCRRVQEMLFSVGYAWVGSGARYNERALMYRPNATLHTYEDGSLCYGNTASSYQGETNFDAATQWFELCAFLETRADAPPAPAPQPTGPLADPRLPRLLGATLLALLKANPAHPLLRGQVRAKTNLRMPDELTTAEAMAEWLLAQQPAPAQPAPRPPASPAPAPAPVRQRGGFSMDVEYEDREYGSASYSVRRWATGTYSLSNDRIRDILEEHDGDVVGAARQIEQELEERCENDPPEDLDYGDYSYEDHNTESTSREAATVDGNVERALRAYLEDHPELMPVPEEEEETEEEEEEEEETEEEEEEATTY